MQFFPWTHHLLVSQKLMQRHFFSTLHPLSRVIFATATVVAFVLLHNSRFNFRCCPQRGATPTQKLAWKWRCDLSRLLARITKGINSCKPALLNRPVGIITVTYLWWLEEGECVRWWNLPAAKSAPREATLYQIQQPHRHQWWDQTQWSGNFKKQGKS